MRDQKMMDEYDDDKSGTLDLMEWMAHTTGTLAQKHAGTSDLEFRIKSVLEMRPARLTPAQVNALLLPGATLPAAADDDEPLRCSVLGLWKCSSWSAPSTARSSPRC